MESLPVSFPRPCAENWDEMTPEGRNRFCAACQQTIFNLSEHGFEEARALLRDRPGTCVRAAIDARGVIQTRAMPGAKAGHLMLAAGISVGLVASSAPAMAKEKEPSGTIAGKIEGDCPSYGTLVVATGSDGKAYEARVNRYGRYTIKRVPPGTYSLRFVPDFEAVWNDGTQKAWDDEEVVVVEADKEAVRDTTDPAICIVIGLAEIDPGSG